MTNRNTGLIKAPSGITSPQNGGLCAVVDLCQSYHGTLQGYLAHKKDPTMEIYLGPYGGPRGGSVFHERGTSIDSSDSTKIFQIEAGPA